MALHRTGILPEQDVHAILLDHDLAFEVRYGCSCGSKGRLGRGSLQFRDDPSLQSLAEDPKAFAEGISGSPGDFKCAIEGEQFKIGSGNIAQDSKHHVAPRFLAGEELGARCFIQTPNTAPEIYFPARVASRRKTVGGISAIKKCTVGGRILLPSDP